MDQKVQCGSELIRLERMAQQRLVDAFSSEAVRVKHRGKRSRRSPEGKWHNTKGQKHGHSERHQGQKQIHDAQRSSQVRQRRATSWILDAGPIDVECLSAGN